MTKGNPAELEPLEWGIAEEDSFFLLAKLTSDPPLELKFLFDRDEHLLVLSYVEVLIAGAAGRGITAELYRSVPVGRAHILASTLIDQGRDPNRKSWPPSESPQPPAQWVDTPRTRHRGRPPLTSHFLAKVAQSYVHHVGQTRGSAIDAVAEEFAVSPSTVSTSWLPKCRDRGLLTRSRRGQAGGALTVEAHDLLEASIECEEPHGTR